MMLSLTESVFDLRSKGVRMVIQNNLFQAIFHILGSILYNANIEEQEQWAPGEYSLATFNFGSLSNHDTFSDIFFNDPSSLWTVGVLEAGDAGEAEQSASVF